MPCGPSVGSRLEHRVRALPTPLPARVAAEIETPLGSPCGGGSEELVANGVPGSGESFARAVVAQAVRLRSAVWGSGERVRRRRGAPLLVAWESLC